jgi:hypothetical protein
MDKQKILFSEKIGFSRAKILFFQKIGFLGLVTVNSVEISFKKYVQI